MGTSSSQSVWGLSGDRKQTHLPLSFCLSFFLSPFSCSLTQTSSQAFFYLLLLSLLLSFLGGGKLLFAVNTFLISCPATLRCEREEIRICIIQEQNRTMTSWTQGQGEELLVWRAVSWQHLLLEMIRSPASPFLVFEGEGCKGERKEVKEAGVRKEPDKGMGETWRVKTGAEQREQGTQRMIHSTCKEISKVGERWRAMVQIGERRWDGERVEEL